MTMWAGYFNAQKVYNFYNEYHKYCVHMHLSTLLSAELHILQVCPIHPNPQSRKLQLMVCLRLNLWWTNYGLLVNW